MFKTRNSQMHTAPPPPQPPPSYMRYMFSVRGFYYNIRRSENILHVPKPRTILSLGNLGYTGAVR